MLDFCKRSNPLSTFALTPERIGVRSCGGTDQPGTVMAGPFEVSMLPTLPETLKLDRPGSCVPTAIACFPQLKDGRDFVIEGWVRFGKRGRLHEHTWMEIDGQTFDPSLVQFRRLRNFEQGPSRQYAKIMTPAEYEFHYLCAMVSPWWRARLQEFGVQL